MDPFCYYVMMSCLFIAALWSPAGKELISRLPCLVFLPLFHVVPWVRFGTLLYRFLKCAFFLTSYCLHNPSLLHWLPSILHREQLNYQLLRILCNSSMFLTETSGYIRFGSTDSHTVLPLSVNQSQGISISYYKFACKSITLL